MTKPRHRPEGITPDPKFWTVAEASALLRVAKMTVYRMVQSGDMDSIRVGRSYRIPDEAIIAYLAQAGVVSEKFSGFALRKAEGENRAALKTALQTLRRLVSNALDDLENGELPASTLVPEAAVIDTAVSCLAQLDYLRRFTVEDGAV